MSGKGFDFRFAPYRRKFITARKPKMAPKICAGKLSTETSSKNSEPMARCSNALDQLPQELLMKIFFLVDLKDLGSLSQTNEKLRDAVLTYILSSDFNRKMAAVILTMPEGRLADLYGHVGFILKKATCILPTPKRLKITEQFYDLNGPLDLASRKGMAACWGSFIKAFINGWECHECERVYRAVCNYGTRDEVANLVNQFLLSEPGSNREWEKRLRIFFRCVFLDPYQDAKTMEYGDDFSYYFDLILRDHSTFHQAKLVYLLFGPLAANGEVEWNLLSDDDYRNAIVYRDMGQALRSLALIGLDPKRNWSHVQISSLIEEVSSFPDNWTLFNFAFLLDYSGEGILSLTLSSRIINGRLRESCDIFGCLISISGQLNKPMPLRLRLFMNILKSLKNRTHQMLLISEMARSSWRRRGHLVNPTDPADDYTDEELTANEMFYGEALRLAFLGNSNDSA